MATASVQRARLSTDRPRAVLSRGRGGCDEAWPDRREFRSQQRPAVETILGVTTKPKTRRPSRKTAPPKSALQHRRDAGATRQRILQAACEAFAREGFTGARIDRIAQASEANVQMIYRYFGGKEELYLAALEDTYTRIRTLERHLDLRSFAPVEGMRRLIEFTFDYLRDNPQFVSIIRNENMIGGRFVRDLPMVSDTTFPLVEAVSDLLTRGRDSGMFRVLTTPMDLYVTILALCITHLAQRETLSVMFRSDLGAPEWLAQRREQVVTIILSYLTTPYQGTS